MLNVRATYLVIHLRLLTRQRRQIGSNPRSNQPAIHSPEICRKLRTWRAKVDAKTAIDLYIDEARRHNAAAEIYSINAGAAGLEKRRLRILNQACCLIDPEVARLEGAVVREAAVGQSHELGRCCACGHGAEGRWKLCNRSWSCELHPDIWFEMGMIDPEDS